MRHRRPPVFAASALACAALCAATALPPSPREPQEPPPAPQEPPGSGAPEAARKSPQDDASYIGAVGCRSCHRSKAKGEQFVHWSTKTPHPRAHETLATPQARVIAERLGLGDPQREAACLECHTTAFGVDEKRLEKSFNPTQGVQCESCHGPGGLHRQRRLAAAREMTPEQAAAAAARTLDIPPGEIRLPTEAVCRSCHNPESPTYKPYDHEKFLARVAHPNPQRPRHRAREQAAGASEPEAEEESADPGRPSREGDGGP